MFDIGKQISFRLSAEQYKEYCECVDKSGLKAKDFIISLLFSKQNINDKNIVFDKKALKMARKEKTEKHFNLFHPKNTLETIIKSAKASFILSLGKSIDMLPIRSIIKEANKVYSLLPKEDKKILKNQMLMINDLDDEERIKTLLGIDNYFKIRKESKGDLEKISFDDGNTREKYA